MSHPVTFDRNLDLLDGAGGVEFKLSADPEAARAVAENEPFQGDVTLAEGAVKLQGGDEVSFDGPDGSVKFSAEARAFTIFAVRADPGAVGEASGLGAALSEALALPDDSTAVFALLGWGYDVEGSGEGSLAFGAPSVKLGLEVKADSRGRFAVVRAFPTGTVARDVMTGTVNAWRMPKQVSSSDDLEPGTWLVSQLQGGLEAGLSTTFGYDYNWLREAEEGDGKLEGTLGLKVAAGVKATLGLTLEGEFALIVARPGDDAHVRARLLKKSEKGWSFAANLGASAQLQLPDDGGVPAEYDDFVKAVLGTHHADYLKALEVIDEWADPDHDLSDVVAGFTSDYVQEVVEVLTELNVEEAFEEARGRVGKLLERWDAIPQKVSEVIWRHLGDAAGDDTADAVAEIREHLETFAGLTPDALREELVERLDDLEFVHGPVGELLEALVGDQLLSLLQEGKPLADLQDLSKQVVRVLDGDAFEGMLVRLHGRVSEKLALDRIREVTEDHSFDDLDGWLQGRLATFLDASGLDEVEERLDEVMQAVDTLLERAPELYVKARNTLTKEYTAELAYAWNRSTEKEALVDAEFDLSVPTARDAYRKFLDGDLKDLLTGRIEGVILRQGVLSHKIRSSRSIELTLPFVSMERTSMNDAVAKFSAVDEDGGRLLLYTLDAEDVVTERHVRTSKLALTARIPKLEGVTRYSESESRVSYVFRQAVRGMQLAQVRYQVRPYIDQYLPNAFSGGEGFDTWLAHIDDLIERRTGNGKETFGNTLLSLELSAPGAVAEAWLDAPSDENDPKYHRMSLALQSKLKELLPFYYLADPYHYVSRKGNPEADGRLAAGLLLYSALPPTTSFKVTRGQVRPTRDDIYWDRGDVDALEALVRTTETRESLARAMATARMRLEATKGRGRGRDHSDSASWYRATAAHREDLINRAMAPIRHGPGSPFYNGLGHLLHLEEKVVRRARKAAIVMVRFDEESRSRPAEAIKALAEFGREVTKTFNSELKAHYGGDPVRPLGQLLFAEAARALGGSAGLEPTASLDLVVLEEDADFPVDDFLNGTRPTEHIVVAERLLGTSVQP